MTWRARVQVASISVFVGVCLLAGLVQGPWRTDLESRPPMPDVPHSKAHAVQGHRQASRQIKLISSAPEPPMPHVHGKLFHGWLKPAGKDSARDNVVAATGGSDKDEDQGGETWWERDHLAAPPAGWHAPVSKAKSAKKHMLAKQEPKEEPNEFHGKGADASPEKIEQEIKKGMKLFGNGKDLDLESDGQVETKAQKESANKPKTIAEKIHARMTTSVAQELHREHRHIASNLHH